MASESAATTESRLATHEEFGKELTRFAQAMSCGDSGQALACRSNLVLHDKALQHDNERLREALARIAATSEPTDQRLSLAWLTWHDLREIARVALGGRL